MSTIKFRRINQRGGLSINYIFEQISNALFYFFGLVIITLLPFLPQSPSPMHMDAPQLMPQDYEKLFDIDSADFNSVLINRWNGTTQIYSDQNVKIYFSFGPSAATWKISKLDENDFELTTTAGELLNDKLDFSISKKIITGPILTPVGHSDYTQGNCPCATIYIEK